MLLLEPQHWERVRRILQALPPEWEVWAFGSPVTGRAHKFSDLDLAIRGPEPVPLTLLGELREAFASSFLPFSVDLVNWHDLPEALKAAVEREGVRILPAEG